MVINPMATHPISPIPTVIPTPTEYQTAGETGFRALWVVFVLMILASATLAGLAWNIPVSRRAYHVLLTLATITSALSHFAMASGQGATFHCARAVDDHQHVPAVHRDLCRQVHWARFVDWAVSTPPLLLALALAAGLDGAHALMAIVADLVMKLSGLFDELAQNRTAQRWGWYAIAWIAYLFVVWHIALQGTRAARKSGGGVAKAWGSLATFFLVLWTVYPIVWGVASGAQRTSVDAEIVVYAILDVLAKAGFGVWLLLAIRRVPEMAVDLDGFWSQGVNRQGAIRIGDDGGP